MLLRWNYSRPKWTKWTVHFNSVVGFLTNSWCVDELLKMFDELIIPAARLLDTVETKIKDYQLTHVQHPPVSHRQQTYPKTNNAHVAEKKSKIVLSFNPPSSTPILFPNQPSTVSGAVSNLKEYKTIVYEEEDVLDWSHCAYNRTLQEKQVYFTCISFSIICRQRKRLKQIRKWLIMVSELPPEQFDQLSKRCRI